jgi:hypothetical protein
VHAVRSLKRRPLGNAAEWRREEGTVKRTRRWLRRRRDLYPTVLPAYLLPPTGGNVVFDRSLRRARDDSTL